MQFSSRQLADLVVAAPVGRIDHAAARSFEEALAPLLADAEAGRSAVVLDFAGVDYISSVGLRVLLIAAKRMRGRNAPIGVAALQPIVAEIFAISRFDRVLDVFPSVRDALERFSAPALAAFDLAAGSPAA